MSCNLKYDGYIAIVSNCINSVSLCFSLSIMVSVWLSMKYKYGSR